MFRFGLVPAGRPFYSKIMATYSGGCRSVLGAPFALRKAARSLVSMTPLAKKLP